MTSKFLPAEEVAKRFSSTHLSFWPSQYRPTPTVAEYLRLSLRDPAPYSSSSSPQRPNTLADFIEAKRSLQSSAAKAAVAGSDDGSDAVRNGGNNALIPQHQQSSSSSSASSYTYSMAGRSPLAHELPKNQKLHLEAAFLDFMSGRDEVWLEKRFDMKKRDTLSKLTGTNNSSRGNKEDSRAKNGPSQPLPRLPWAPMSLSQRKKMLKKVTARDRLTLPSFIEMCEFLNIPLPCDIESYNVGNYNSPSWPPHVSSSSSSSPYSNSNFNSVEEQLEVYLHSVPEELPCDVEITDFKAKGTRVSRSDGTLGIKMGSDPSQAPQPAAVGVVRSMAAAEGTLRHSMERVVKIYERDLARVERGQRRKSNNNSGGGGGAAAVATTAAKSGGADDDGNNEGGGAATNEVLPPLPSPPRFYHFTSYAAQQAHALRPLAACTSLDDPVLVPTYSQLRDLLQVDYFDSYGVGNYLSSITGDGLVLTREFVYELAEYLAKRWNTIAAEMASAHAAATYKASSSSSSSLLPKPGPILLPFGNGRLAYHLNETGILPTRAYATSRLPERVLYPSVLGYTTLEEVRGVGLGRVGSGNTAPSSSSSPSEDSPPVSNGEMPYPFPSAFYNTSTIRHPSIVAKAPRTPMPPPPPADTATSQRRGGGGDDNNDNNNDVNNSADSSLYMDLPTLPFESFSPSSSSSSSASTNTNGTTSSSGNSGAAPALDPSFTCFRYPIHTEVSVMDALRVYQPSIVIAEPHTTRDYSADMRGCASVREVVFIGPVDGPAMGSFSFPWLTFGVSPSPDTFELYNDSFQLHGVGGGGGGGGGRGRGGGGRSPFSGGKMQMPMDPPYMAQGYRRIFLDRISSLTILPNDSAEVPRQGRCLAFRRLV